MSQYSNARLRGKLESLEARQMLAGDVLVSVVNGTLEVEGDGEANKVLIAAGAEAGAFVVTGLDNTTLEGESDPITVTGVRNIRVDLGDGDDLAALVGADVRGKVAIDAGDGADRVLVGTGEGVDELDGLLPDDVSVEIRGSLKIETDGGADEVAVDATASSKLSIDTGDDDDLVSLGSTEELGELDARLEVKGAVHVELGDGNDEFHADQVDGRKGVFADGGEGDDTIDVSLLTGATLFISGDEGLDIVKLADLDVKLLGVHTGDGNDNVDVQDSVFAALGVALGDGDDTLLTANLEAKFSLLAGGDGEDTIDNAIGSVFKHERILGFEIPPDVNLNELLPSRRFLGRALRGLLN
jgi:hypothetical protein